MLKHPSPEEKIHSELIDLLKGGTIPWRSRCGCNGLNERHGNLITGSPYPAIDQVILAVAMARRNFSRPWWCSYIEAREAGLSPRKGAESIVLGLGSLNKQSRFRRTNRVFNVADLVGAPWQEVVAKRRLKQEKARWTKRQSLERAEAILKRWPVPMHEGQHLPSYCIERDVILLPPRQRFLCRESFLAIWAREQIHSTWHVTRAGEKTMPERSATGKTHQAFVCELAWILIADCLDLGRGYGSFVLAIPDWIKALEHSPELFLRLLIDARNAVQLLTSDQELKGSADKGNNWCASPPLDLF